MEEINTTDYSDNQGFLEEPKKESKTLMVLCILSLISISFALITAILNFLNGPLTAEELDKSFTTMNSVMSVFGNSSEVELAKKIAYERMTMINTRFYLHGMLNLITLVTGLIGALLMLQKKKIGFHFYIIYSILSFTFIYFIVPIKLAVQNELIMGALFSGIWVFLYARQLKHLN
jgi:hypothetical protein